MLPTLLTSVYDTHWSAKAENLDRTDEYAVQQLADKIRAAGHVTAEDVQSCVEIFALQPSQPQGATRHSAQQPLP